MIYILLLLNVFQLQGYLEEAVVLLEANKSTRIMMFGDYHEDGGPHEGGQFNAIKNALSGVSSQKQPLRVLLEKPVLLVRPPQDSSILWRVSTLAEPNVTVENIETRASANMALAILSSPYPKILSSPYVENAYGKIFSLNKVTFEDVFELFDHRKQEIHAKLEALNLGGKLFEPHLNQADHFLDEIKKRLDKGDNEYQTKIVTLSHALMKNSPDSRGVLHYMISGAFCPLFDVHAVCRVKELQNEHKGDIALFTGTDHTDKIAFMLERLGAYRLHRYKSPSVADRPLALNQAQLDIFDIQPSTLDSGYLCCKQMCAIQ